MANKSIFKTSVTIILILVLAGIIFYPKLEPVFNSNETPGPQARARMGGGEPLYASGYVLVPQNLNE
ncbi:MAG TPA: hypothetical protein VJ919_05490, partial [Tangfeifania sp.]|nr:hypothetical protein [Tangfeifania sp.]